MSASQVGQYAYCARAWWLGEIEGHEPADLGALEQGAHAHERHGWRVSLARTFSRLALVTLGAALIALAIWAATFLL